MILDNNLIAYEYFKNQYTLNPVYPSGEKQEDSIIDKYGQNLKELPVLILERDIVNQDGRGLKQGFYNIIPDKYLDFFLIYQSGKLKAKVPIIETKVIASTQDSKQEKPKRMSDSRYRKKLEKEQRKYFKGENPAEVEFQEVEIIYDRQKEAYLIIYYSNNLELTGIIKF